MNKQQLPGQGPERRQPRRERTLLLGAAAALVVTAAGYSAVQHGGEAIERRETYAWHDDVTTTVFWVGEQAGPDNAHIDNVSSAWKRDWVQSFGGIDDPNKRNGYLPAGFTPLENPFYFALPFSDVYRDGKRKPAAILSKIPWYTGKEANNVSIIKNRWIEVQHQKGGAVKTAYAQWQDVGPFEQDDHEYIFGEERPKDQRAGLDLSPATGTYLGIGGRGETSWRFIDAADVPDGPWKRTVTTSNPDYKAH